MSKSKKIFNILSTVLLLATTVLVVFVFVLRLTGARPKLLGYYVFNVASDSMTPMLKVDDVILVKACTAQEVHDGDVITYHGEAGDLAGKDITHKVIEEPETDSDGTVRILTRGIKPGAMTDPVVSGGQVLGKYVCKLHVLSILFTVFKKWYGLVIFLGIIFALMGKEIYNLSKLSKKAEKIEPLTEEQIQQILKEAAQKQAREANGEPPSGDASQPPDDESR